MTTTCERWYARAYLAVYATDPGPLCNHPDDSCGPLDCLPTDMAPAQTACRSEELGGIEP